MKLDELLPKYGVNSLSEDEKVYLNRIWHCLEPWPDAVVVPHAAQAERCHLLAWNRNATECFGKTHNPGRKHLQAG